MKKFAAITTGILLLYFFATIPIACRAEEIKPSGNDFSSAVNLYMSAPTNNYDYQPAIDAFSKIAGEAKDKETEFRARYFLALANFCATKFDEAYKQADACCALAKQIYPEDIRVKIAGITDFVLSGVKEKNESNFPAVNDVIFTNSSIKSILPGANEENLLGIAETIEILDTLAPMERMWPTTVYQNARDKINLIRQRGNITADETLVIGMMEKNMACLKESTGSQFALTCGILALLIDKCGAVKDEVKNSITAAMCCHNLRQLGLAFHMYVLDNNDSFPPLNVTGKMPDSTSGNIPWMTLVAPYLNINNLPHIVNNHLTGDPGYHYYFSSTSVFMCPGDSWFLGIYNNDPVVEDLYVAYGYNNMANWGPKMSQIIPSRQLVLADSTGERNHGYQYYGSYHLSYYMVSPRHNGFVNVLYADGHVNAEDINWLWKADPSGTPWNSNNPYTLRKDVDWPFWLPKDAK